MIKLFERFSDFNEDMRFLIEYFEKLQIIEKHFNVKFKNFDRNDVNDENFRLISNITDIIKDGFIIMDFDDEKVTEINNEYMFGKSILVAPVLNAQYTPETIVKTDENSGWNKNEKKDNNIVSVDFTQPKTSKVYLPSGTKWFDFWTNKSYSGGQELTTQTSIDKIPLYIKAGSILALGPQVQFATEKKWDNLEIRVYPGADGEFTLYEDENDNYNYEKNTFSTILFK